MQQPDSDMQSRAGGLSSATSRGSSSGSSGSSGRELQEVVCRPAARAPAAVLGHLFLRLQQLQQLDERLPCWPSHGSEGGAPRLPLPPSCGGLP